MEDETPTPQDPSAEASEVIYGEIVLTRAQEAYEMKLSGRTPREIADELGYESPMAVVNAIRSQMKSEASFLTDTDRQSLLQMEMDRLDRLLAKVWPSAMTGDPKSVEAALKITDRRIKITGLDAVDTTTQAHTVLVIGGQEQDYISKLKELADD